MAVTDDDIIRRRLLIDGDGGNDDKRINSLLRMLVRWCNMPENDEESHLTYQRMLATLAQCEYNMEKSVLVYEMNLTEQKKYEHLNQDIEEKISEATSKIIDCKQELQEAKRIRKNRQEYDALAKVIQRHPDRLETTKQLQELDKELVKLKNHKNQIQEKLDLRRKQFHVLISAIHDLEGILEDDEKKEDMETN
ncbi:THO complex subunit 7 homolog [Octopus vulgaris]|uniref:THO complex subunit 7 homolog n=2 Tax=Octopus TaxID=6643 RepID=A0AA36F3J1_OCTVU|nr:THO complex subunit 7 homolog isoform X2 [Octopus bimaculoides]XP_029637934.1 THO complex subunit 7 homolog isoform X3 [Octopus sinensis]CAI9724386.1 THO complex subunit 7 homolog [Octopus vulgaris]|eukprot:XP_014772035.1 PREDICTED: THO complex subunit 7 homolog isoform X2 [Octopus bimaculoides]